MESFKIESFLGRLPIASFVHKKFGVNKKQTKTMASLYCYWIVLVQILPQHNFITSIGILLVIVLVLLTTQVSSSLPPNADRVLYSSSTSSSLFETTSYYHHEEQQDGSPFPPHKNKNKNKNINNINNNNNNLDVENPFLPSIPFHYGHTATNAPLMGVSEQQQQQLGGGAGRQPSSKMRLFVDPWLSVEPNRHDDEDDDDDDEATEQIPNLVAAESGTFFPQIKIPKLSPPTTVPLLLSSRSSLLDRRHCYRKTGTTIAGMVVGDEYCILAADTRATMGMTIAETRAEKLHSLTRRTNQIWAAGAGTSADLQHLTRLCRYQFQLQNLQYDETIGNTMQQQQQQQERQQTEQQQQPKSSFPSMAAVCHWLRSELYQQGGECQANLIVGGICPQTLRPSLHALHPHGSIDTVPFTALGSGGMAAMAILEQSWTKYNSYQQKQQQQQHGEMTLEEAVNVLIRAIRAGIENDLGSGSQIDIVIIRIQKTQSKKQQQQQHSHSNSHDDNDDNKETTTAVVITTEYRRAAVPEPQLPPFMLFNDTTTRTTTKDHLVPQINGNNNDNNSRSSSSSSSSTSGVNGFGNTPFLLKPVHTTTMPPRHAQQAALPLTRQQVQQKQDEWNAALGI